MENKKLEEIKKVQQKKLEELNRELGLSPADFSGVKNMDSINGPKTISSDFNFDSVSDIGELNDERLKELKKQGKSK